MHKTSHNTTDDRFIIHTTSALSTFPILISVHYRIVRCLPPSITQWSSLLSCTSFSMCFSCTSVHASLLLFLHLHFTWSVRFVLHLLSGNLSAIFIFGTINRILLQSIWHPYHILLPACPSRSYHVIHLPIHIASRYPCARPYRIPLSTCPSISHPVIHVPVHIASRYPCARPYRIPLSMCPSVSHRYPRARPYRIL
jgi:hypothetical protein